MKFLNVFHSLGIIAIASTLLIACGSKKKDAAPVRREQGPMQVDAFLVEKRTLSEDIEVPGSVVADEATEILPEISGRITQLFIKEGAYVSKGTVLAKLYDADLQAQKKKLEVQLEIAKQTEERYEQLQKIGGISKQDYDLTKLNVSNIRADLDIINTSIAKTVIRAPFSGKLGLKGVSTGAFVTPSTVITTIQKTNGLRLDFNLPEKYIGRLNKGQYVNFTVEGGNRTYTAVVEATESGIAQETRTLTLRARVRGDETGLVPGAFAKVKVSFDPDPNALMVPTQALISQARGKKIYVYRGGRADFVDVTTGIRDSSMVQITSGLNAGDTVIITGLLALKPEAKVAIRQVTNSNK